ncbi:MAG: hypothetical protein JWQ04_2226 [Pedosphaera sp.]|nr:hypothetical protein [Pedosphaera sp.]
MKMKKMILMASAILAIATGARADDWWSTHAGYSTDHQQLFNANELQLDLFGTYQVDANGFFPDTFHNNKWGGGVGGNYFFTRYTGIGVDTAFLAKTPHFDDHVGGNVYLRLPIEVVRLAPYAFGGGGRAFNPTARWFWDVGAGLEFRLNPKLALFADGRYIWKHDAISNQSAIRTGIRLVF